MTDDRYGTTLALRRCGACGFIFAESEELSRLEALYEELDDESYAATSAARRLQMRRLVDQLLRRKPTASSLLDVGAGIGLLVAEAARRGLDAVGVEPSRPLAARAAEQHGHRVLSGRLPHPELEGRTFDLVTIIDVIEHVDDPIGLLRSSAAHLTDGGVLAVVTPDVSSVMARLLGRRWWHYRLAHVGYFTPATLRRAAAAAGLHPVAQHRPRWHLPAGYLAERAKVYLPLTPIISLARRIRPLRHLGRLVIPLDLRDSILVFLQLDRP